MASKKQYGLILHKSKPVAVNRLSAFQDDSDDDAGVFGGRKKVHVETANAKVKKQTHLEIKKALEEDPSVYEYDSIYDDMVEKKREEKSKEKSLKDRKPKYIQALLKTAEVRKIEEERRVERKVQKEREAEGEEFADKESFVTSAYWKKMHELEEQEEKERREAQLEALTDVTKQTDLSGFYRHLYKQTMGNEQPKKDQSVEDKDDEKSDVIKVETRGDGIPKKEDFKHEKLRKRRSSSGESTDDSDSHESKSHRSGDRDTVSSTEDLAIGSKSDLGEKRKVHSSRYRSRHSSDSSEEEHDAKRISRSHGHRGNRHSRDSRRQKETKPVQDSRRRQTEEKNENVKAYKGTDREKSRHKRRHDSCEEENLKTSIVKADDEDGADSVVIGPKDGWLRYFERRNTTESIELARQRYLERKKAREKTGNTFCEPPE